VLLWGFFRETLQRVGNLFQPASTMFQPASVHHAHMSGGLRSVLPRRCSLASSP
jgi:hypothetical protein